MTVVPDNAAAALPARENAARGARLSYSEQLKHPRWQQKRLRVLERAGFKCERCGADDRMLNAHHKIYLKGRRPWEYDDRLLECVCDHCHHAAHAEKDELELIVAQQPTAKLPKLIDAAVAVANDDPPHDLTPRMRSLFDKLGAALSGGGNAAWVDAQNDLQDLIDEGRDFLRGPGG